MKSVQVLLEDDQLRHLQAQVQRGRAASVEELIVKLVEKDRYTDDTPLDDFLLGGKKADGTPKTGSILDDL